MLRRIIVAILCLSIYPLTISLNHVLLLDTLPRYQHLAMGTLVASLIGYAVFKIDTRLLSPD
jgi:hypothetical protein